ncbi:MAG: alpha/beta hydrolase [Chloroflexaceae bacterium]|nr:alpha/beta hydrolase [Chloroflexaceae bacterium]
MVLDRLSQEIGSRAHSFYYPLSLSMLPLAMRVAQSALSRYGVVTREYRLCDTPMSLYYAPAQDDHPQRMAVLLVHGVTANAITWALQIPSLRSIGPVYAVDLPGFGLSGLPPGKRYSTLHDQCAVLQAVINDVIQRPTLVVGYSLGGWLAVRLAWMMPQMVTGAVIINSGGALLKGADSWLPFLEKTRMRNLAAVITVCQELFYSPVVRLVFAIGLASVQWLFAREQAQQFFLSLQADDFLHADELRELPVPAALLWGMQDTFLPEGSFEFFRDNLPHAFTLFLSNCGHMPIWDTPLTVSHFIRAFAQHLYRTQAAGMHQFNATNQIPA